MFSSVYGVQTLSMRLKKRSKWQKSGIFFVELRDFGPTFGALNLRIFARPAFGHLIGLDKGFFFASSTFVIGSDRIRNEKKKQKKNFNNFQRSNFSTSRQVPVGCKKLWGRKNNYSWLRNVILRLSKGETCHICHIGKPWKSAKIAVA